MKNIRENEAERNSLIRLYELKARRDATTSLQEVGELCVEIEEETRRLAAARTGSSQPSESESLVCSPS